jgi:hypothetical protein
MILKIFAIRDNKVGAFMRPFIEQSEIQATRALHQAVNDKAIQISMFAEDFDLYRLGEVDDQSGKLTTEKTPEFICSAESLKKLEKEVQNDKK